MTLNFYQLKEPPFGSIPDHRFLFLNSAHRQALGSVLIALQQGKSAVSLIGQTGLGKTTLLFHMFKTLAENVTAVYLFQPPQTPVDLLRAILAELGVREMDEIPQEMLRLLKVLLADQVQQQKRVVVVIDEAQNLEPSVLEVLWLLSNPAGKHGRLLQFVLSGQCDMADTVTEPESGQLTYRSPIVAHLEPLGQEDTALYIDHRLRVAGYGGNAPLFTPEANALIARYSDGVPRKINNLCFRSMLWAYKTRQRTIEAETVRAVIADLGLEGPRQRVIGPVQAPELALPELSARVLSMPRVKPVEEPLSVSRPGKVVAFPAIAKGTNVFSGLIPRVGLVAAVLLTLTATLVNLRGHAPRPAAPHSAFRTPAPALLPPAPAPEHDLKGMDLNAAVRALHRRSLNDLCKANFGQCDSKQLQEMQKVNPRRKNSAHTETSRGPAEAATERALASSN